MAETFHTLCCAPWSCGDFDLKGFSENRLSYSLFCPERERNLPRITQPAESIADTSVLSPSMGSFLPIIPICFLPKSPPQNTELPLWQLPPGVPVSLKYRGGPQRHLYPMSISVSPHSRASDCFPHSAHGEVPPFPSKKDPGDPKGWGPPGEKDTDLMRQERGTEGTIQTAKRKSGLGRTCQGMFRGAERGPLLIGHP